MSINPTKTLPAVWALVLLATAPVLGQQLQSMEPFASAEMSTYGGGYRPNEGFFFDFDVLNWWIAKPETVKIGDPIASRRVVITPQVDIDVDDDGVLDQGAVIEKVVERSSRDTGVLTAKDVPGQRYEFGYIEDH